MEITIEWTEEDVDHIRKHNVEPNEVESIFGFKYYHRKRGNFIDVIGRTSGSRYIKEKQRVEYEMRDLQEAWIRQTKNKT